MKISIFVPSNRINLATCARLLDYCALASDDVEIAIRDNSGDPAKQEFLQSLRPRLHPHCKIESVPLCAAWENSFKAVEMTTGDYIIAGMDDDMVNPMAMSDLCAAIEQYGQEPGVIGVTGQFLIEEREGSKIDSFPELNQTSALARAKTYLLNNHSSVVQFSPTLRASFLHLIGFIRSFPFQGSYTDQIWNALLASMGRLVPINRVIYHYDKANWSSYESCLREDTKYYTYAGVDSSAVRLHWLFCAFEGMLALLNKFSGLSHVSAEDRSEIAKTWFVVRMMWFRQNPSRPGPNEKFGEEAEKIGMKWKQASAIDISQLLTDLTSYIALSNPALAERYFAFWKL